MQYIQFIIQGFQSAGAWAMWMILIVGFLALALVVERIYYVVVRCGMGREKFMTEIFRIIKTGDVAKAIKFSGQFDIPLAKVFTAILSNKDKGEKAVNNAIDEVFLTEIPRIQRYIPLLMTAANVATLLGLLGTIFGLMLAFEAVANVPAAQRAAKLAEGIKVAMSTTAFGLVIAIPTMFIYGFITAQSERIIEEMDEKSAKLVNIVLG
jgi:biopolymer transport protein ExbB/TolQ